MAQKKQVRTSVLIDNDAAPLDDFAFIKLRHFKPTNLLRAKIKELREKEEGKPDAEQLLKNIQSLQERIKGLFDFIDTKGLFSEFLEQERSRKS